MEGVLYPFVEVGLIYAVSRILQNQREERLSDCLSRNTVYSTLFTLVVTESIFSTALGASQVTFRAKCDGSDLGVGHQRNVVYVWIWLVPNQKFPF